MRRHSGLSLVIVAASLMLSGCGDSSGASGNAGTTEDRRPELQKKSDNLILKGLAEAQKKAVRHR